MPYFCPPPTSASGQTGCMKHIGVLGHSWPGAAECFSEICRQSGRLGHPDHPDVTLDCISYEPLMPAYDSGEYIPIRETLATSVERLERAGAQFFVCPDNTCHPALELAGPSLAIPGLHIVQEVAEAAATAGYRRLGILGTRFTMNGALYPRELAARGIETLIPELADLHMVDHLTFTELVHGVFTDDTRARFVDVISRLQARGADAVALVCTEHPLLITPTLSPLPTLDSTRLVAHAAVDIALGRRELPTWRGGPLSANT